VRRCLIVQEVRVDELIVNLQIGKVPHVRTLESFESIGTESMPKRR
jgi:hypothetical protein